MERRLDTEEFIIDLFCRVDHAMAGVPKRSDASLWPGEIATLGVLFALRGTSERAFDRWLRRQWLMLFPRLPHRTRLFRLFATHADWTDRFLARPSFFGIADSYGIELINTRRLKRSPRQIAKRGKCGGRWIAGVKWGLVINNRGRVCAWDVTTANVYDANAFAPLIQKYAKKMIVLADGNFHKSEHHRKNDHDPPNLKVCPRGWWNQRRLIETVLSMLQRVCRLKHLSERTWPAVRAHLGFVAMAFNLLTRWTGRNVRLSIAQFAL